eukprot:449220_1
MSKFATLLVVGIVIAGTTAASIAESPSSDSIEDDLYRMGFVDFLREFESSADVLPGLYLTPNQVVHSIDTVLGGLDMMELWHHQELLESHVDLEVMDAQRNNYIDAILTWVDHQVAKSNALGGLSPEEKKELDDGVTEVLEFLQKKFTERNKTIDRSAGDENSFSGMQPKKLLLENFLENHKSGEMKIAWLKAHVAPTVVQQQVTTQSSALAPLTQQASGSQDFLLFDDMLTPSLIVVILILIFLVMCKLFL